MKSRRGMTAIEVIMAMMLVALAITTVAYIFAGTVTRVGRSKILTQAAFLGQAVMDAALLADPFEPVIIPANIGPPGQGFTYTVNQRAFSQDQAYFEVEIKVFHNTFPPNQPAVTLASLRRYGGIKR